MVVVILYPFGNGRSFQHSVLIAWYFYIYILYPMGNIKKISKIYFFDFHGQNEML